MSKVVLMTFKIAQPWLLSILYHHSSSSHWSNS
jgi:hypothetical protein